MKDLDLEGATAIRLVRQAILAWPNPPQLHVIIGEAVVRQREPGIETTWEQLAHPLEVIKFDHVTLQVLPFDAMATLTRSSEFLEVGDQGAAVTKIEINSRTVYKKDMDDVRKSIATFDPLPCIALSEATSYELISRLLSKMDLRRDEAAWSPSAEAAEAQAAVRTNASRSQSSVRIGP